MNNYTLYFIIVVFFNCYIQNVLAENKYYLISIRRDSNDVEYDKANGQVQNAIDELVNDRMNDIYDIISENKETYITETGNIDQKLEELSVSSQLRKRSEFETNKNYKFRFINKNRPKTKRLFFKLNSMKENDDVDYIPFESKLVTHICPVSNYYVVVAYLSDDVAEKIKTLPNIINCTESKKSVMEQTINYAPQYYNKEEILNETKWKDLSVQENRSDFELRHSHLSLVSQGKFDGNSNTIYDNNYYYPSTAGKGIDVFMIDSGFDASLSKEDFDTYEGTSDERIIRCEGEFFDGQYHAPSNDKSCNVLGQEGVKHGTLVAISAVGKINGSAKKASLHMLASTLEEHDQLNALDYIKQHAIPHRTVVNISRGCSDGMNCYSQEIQNKITELVDLGIIIFVSGGNTGRNSCKNQSFRSCEGVIPIGAINNKELDDYENMEAIYEIADYSSYGECIVLFAPGTVRVMDIESNTIKMMQHGTSFATPVVAGIAATIMSENFEIEYNYELMKNLLIELSIKDVIMGLDSNTPNRLVNNGKRTIYKPPRCDDPSGLYSCQEGCCSKQGYCVDINTEYIELKSLCLVDNGCASEFGKCSTTECGSGRCSEGECCTKDGQCLNMFFDFDNQCFY